MFWLTITLSKNIRLFRTPHSAKQPGFPDAESRAVCIYKFTKFFLNLREPVQHTQRQALRCLRICRCMLII